MIVLYYDINEYVIMCQSYTSIAREEAENNNYKFTIAPAVERAIINLQEHYYPELINDCCERSFIYPEPAVLPHEFKEILEGVFDYKEISIEKFL